jgi:hypothetical protein
MRNLLKNRPVNSAAAHDIAALHNNHYRVVNGHVKGCTEDYYCNAIGVEAIGGPVDLTEQKRYKSWESVVSA